MVNLQDFKASFRKSDQLIAAEVERDARMNEAPSMPMFEATLSARLIAPCKISTDPEYKIQGGWKVHLALPESGYHRIAQLVTSWIENNFAGDWKHQAGGDLFETDFTIYCGSFDTMMDLVKRLENSPIVELLQTGSAPGDRIFGETSKVMARFCTKGTLRAKGTFDICGLNGIPISEEYSHLCLMQPPEKHRMAIEQSEKLLIEKFGCYFIGKDNAYFINR